MYTSHEEVLFSVVLGTALLIFFVCFFILAILQFQKNQLKNHLEKNQMQKKYEQEILQAQLEMQEQTFLSISQEIHDNIGQILSLIRLNISTLNPNDYISTERKITTSKELLDQAIEDLRILSKRLNKEFINQQNLSDSLKFQLNLIERSGLYKTQFVLLGEERPINPEKKLIIFRIVQEALNNIIKHARAKSIAVNLSYLSDILILDIQDDGSGFEIGEVFNQEASPKGIGMHNMYYRASMIGAKFTIQSNQIEGTLAQLVLPINS